MANDLIFQLTFDSNGEPVIKNITAAVDRAKQGFGTAGQAADQFVVQGKKLTPVIGVIAAEFGNINAGANLLSRGLSGLVLGGFTPVGVAISTVLLAGGLLQDFFRDSEVAAEKAKEGLKTFADSVRAAQGLRADIGFSTRLVGADTEVAKVAIQQEQARSQLARSFERMITDERLTLQQQAQIRGERNQTIAALDAQFLAQQTQARIKDGEAIARERQGLIDSISARQFEAAAIGRSGEALLALQSLERIAIINSSELARKDRDVAGSMIEAEKAALKLATAYDRIKTGRDAISQAQQQFGVQFDFDKKLAGEKLADQFEILFNDPRAKGQIGQAFKSFSEQALALGVPDIPELLSGKIGSLNFERLKLDLQQNEPVFGKQIIDQLNATQQAGQQWGKVFRQELLESEISAGRIGTALAGVKQEYESLTAIAARTIAIDVDANQAIADARTLKESVLSIPERKTVVIDVVINGGELLSQLQRQVEQTTGRVLDFQVLN